MIKIKPIQMQIKKLLSLSAIEAQYGVANSTPKWGDIEPEGSLKNKSFGVSLGYQFE